MPGGPEHHDVRSLDVQVLQTAASLENLVAGCYGSAVRLAAVKDGNPTLGAFIVRTGAQHAAHASAFNAAVARAGGAAQHAPDPRYAASVRRALTSLTDAASLVSLLESLEDVNAQSYTRYASLASANVRALFVSVAAVEAAHRSFLLAVLQLLNLGATDLIRIPTIAGRLPDAIGSGCFAPAFYSTKLASAIDEGSVR